MPILSIILLTGIVKTNSIQNKKSKGKIQDWSRGNKPLKKLEGSGAMEE